MSYYKIVAILILTRKSFKKTRDGSSKIVALFKANAREISGNSKISNFGEIHCRGEFVSSMQNEFASHSNL